MTRHTRLEQAEHIAVAEARWAAGETQRGVAAASGVARSTLQAWCREVPRGDPPAGLTAFARTPDGGRGCIGWCWRRTSASPCGRRAAPDW